MFLVAFFLLVIVLLLLFLRHRAKAGKRLALELEKHFRIYALVSEYFFEYDFQDGRLMVTLPRRRQAGNCGVGFFQTAARQEGLGPGRGILDLIRSGRDGVWEMEAEFIDGKPTGRIALETVRDGGRPVYALGKINIIDGEKREKDTLQEKAQLDSLTHIYNAEACRLLVAERLARKRGKRGQRPAAAGCGPFQGEVNDTYGHLRGISPLEAVARLLQANAGEGDIVGRPGGDEFYRLPDPCGRYGNAGKRCEQLWKRLRSLLVAGKIAYRQCRRRVLYRLPLSTAPCGAGRPGALSDKARRPGRVPHQQGVLLCRRPGRRLRGGGASRRRNFRYRGDDGRRLEKKLAAADCGKKQLVNGRTPLHPAMISRTQGRFCSISSEAVLQQPLVLFSVSGEAAAVTFLAGALPSHSGISPTKGVGSMP